MASVIASGRHRVVSRHRRQDRDKKSATAGNRTRAARVAGEHSTTEPPMLMGTDALQSVAFRERHLDRRRTDGATQA